MAISELRKACGEAKMGSRVLVWLSLFAAALSFASCNQPETIVPGYQISDVGHASQVIIGDEGRISVDRVTAYAVDGKRIFVELDSSDPAKYRRIDSCEYKLIETSRHQVVDLRKGSTAYSEALQKLRHMPKSAFSRSCVLRSR